MSTSIYPILVEITSVYVEQLRRAYGDLNNPRRSFALDCLRRAPYKAVFAQLAQNVPAVDGTDINSDVCFTYILEWSPVLIVKLSMVGPYAVILSFGGNGLDVSAELHFPGEGGEQGACLRVVGEVLAEHGFVLPSRSHLEHPVPMSIDGHSSASLYAALFEPRGLIPWMRGDQVA